MMTRQKNQQIEMHLITIEDLVPDHSTISQNRRRRFNGSNLFRNIFQKTVTVCIEKGLADGKLVFTDSTHIKANASRKTEYMKLVDEISNWSEGSFAAQKARHNLKFLYRRGLEAAEQQCLLLSTALNLKRMIKAFVSNTTVRLL